MKKEMNILFLCKHNVFRSKTAEAYFKKLNKNKNLHVESAGFIKTDWIRKYDAEVIKLEQEALRKKGINFKAKSRGLGIELLKDKDLIVIISDDLPNIFTESYLKKNLEVRIWKIKDVLTKEDSKTKLDFTINKIMKKVEALVKELS